jgi:NAD(P)-dependent dehydrogenase (short-subunit alcohol dehydrogenase family)
MSATKNAVVTGANRGLGFEIVKQLCERDEIGKVYALCRKTSYMLSALESPKVVVVEDIDVSSDEVMTKLKSYFRTDESDMIPIDLLIHNAGSYGPPEDFANDAAVFKSQNLDTITMDRMRFALELNTLGPLRVTQALLPNVKSGGSDTKIIIITSLMGSITDNTSGGSYGYRTAKAGVNMIGKSMAEDLRSDKIAVSMIHPGMVLTGFGGTDGQDRPVEKRWPGQKDVGPSVKGVLDAIDATTMENIGVFLHGNYGKGVKPLNW